MQPASEHGHIADARNVFQRAHRFERRGCFELKQRVGAQACAQIRRRPQRDHPSAIHQRQPVAVLGFVHVVGADENGVAGARHFANQIPECPARDGIDSRSRLIQKQNRGIVQDRAAQRQALFPSAGKSCRHRAAALGQIGHFKHILLALRAQIPGNAVHSREKVDVLLYGEIVVERKLLRHVADVFAHLLGFDGHIQALDQSAPGGGRQQSAQHADGRGFSGSVRAQKSEDLPLADLQGNVIDGDERAEGFYQSIRFYRPVVH